MVPATTIKGRMAPNFFSWLLSFKIITFCDLKITYCVRISHSYSAFINNHFYIIRLTFISQYEIILLYFTARPANASGMEFIIPSLIFDRNVLANGFPTFILSPSLSNQKFYLFYKLPTKTNNLLILTNFVRYFDKTNFISNISIFLDSF